MYLASYTLHYCCDGATSDDRYIIAETLDELHQKMAEEHYRSRYYSDEIEKSAFNFTDNWRIYEFKETTDIKVMPEFLTLLEARSLRIEKANERKARDAETARLQLEQEERETYARLKEKFDGDTAAVSKISSTM